MKRDELAPPVMLKLDGKEYVVLPKNDYYRLLGKAPPDAVDAITFARGTVASNLKKARTAAGLTRSELARRIGRTVASIADAETGHIAATPRYVAQVLQACGLPKDWMP